MSGRHNRYEVYHLYVDNRRVDCLLVPISPRRALAGHCRKGRVCSIGQQRRGGGSGETERAS